MGNRLLGIVVSAGTDITIFFDHNLSYRIIPVEFCMMDYDKIIFREKEQMCKGKLFSSLNWRINDKDFS